MMMPKQAIILAAGVGQRMQPLTHTTPKPLLRVAGRSFLDRLVDALVAVGIERIVVNHHYLGEQIVAWAATRRDAQIILSDESDMLLDTGGGVAKVLPLFQGQPFFTVNGDALWRDYNASALARMAALWRDDVMDAVLLLHETARVIGHAGAGDYDSDGTGHIAARGAKKSADYVFAGVTLTHPRLYTDAPKGAFSQKLLWDKAEKQKRLYGLVNDGEWYHVATPDDLHHVNTVFR